MFSEDENTTKKHTVKEYMKGDKLMAQRSKSNKKDSDYSVANDKSFKRQLNNLNNMIGDANLSMYGTDRTSDVDTLNNKFQSLLSNQLDDLTHKSTNDITSFLGQIISSDNKTAAMDELLNNQFMSMTGDEYSTMQSFIYEAYQNRLLEQSDLHEVASQLIELSEAILITRDSIVSADVVEGRMSRTLDFDNIDESESDNNKSVIEKMEEKFKLLEKIKNFIIPKTLEYGEFYVYAIPYSKLFDSFMNSREKDYSGRVYRESTLIETFESVNASKRDKNKKDDLNTFIESTYEKYNIQESTKYNTSDDINENKISKKEFAKDMKNILGNITVCNEAVPFPILEEGLDSISYIKEYTNSVMTEAKAKKEVDWFQKVNQSNISSEGISFQKKQSKKSNQFNDITDCYIKMIEPTKMIPLKIMDTIIGYYYVQDEDITPLSGAISSTLYFNRFNEHRRETTVIDAIAERVVKSFDKPFLKNNIKFKKVIADCINYYNLNEKRLKFQFIPVEYIQEFKIDEDIDGNGTSMIKKSLFYAKLYLMLLLFKIMSIILYSNDTKVNYLKQSGIDKNVANKVQEIARIRQSRQVNITDLFSYTTLINKVGSGSEMYIPTGRSGERPIETEILGGQDVQLNSDLLEMLKNAYILGTGVPAAIVNYMQEADFAKVIEQNNTKFNARVVNYQLDFNSNITELYKKLMRWSTNINENVIENFKFTLQPPKTTSINAKTELINNFTALSDFLVSLIYDNPDQAMNAEGLQQEIKTFKKLLAKEQLPMLDIDKVMEIAEKAKIETQRDRLRPEPDNGDNGDDTGLDDDISNMKL